MKITSRVAAMAVAGALVLGGIGVAESATAAEIPGSTLTITPTTGNATDAVFLNSIYSTTAAPLGYRNLSGTFIYQNGVELGSIATARTPALLAEYGNSGLDGIGPMNLNRTISPTNNYVSNKSLSAIPGLVSGQFELRYYYFASSTSPNRVTDPYIKLDLTYNATTGVWAVYTAPVAAIVTTTSLTASAAASTVTLTATIKKPDASTATDAAGSVAFKSGSTTVATSTVVNGVATATLTSVADGPYTYTAEFTPSDAVYAASTSAGASVTVGAILGSSDIQVTIPSGVGSLTLTGVSTSVNLGTAALSGGTLNASGTLNATVTDTRQLGSSAWSLTGQVSDFTATGGKTIDGKYLGWTPSIGGTAAGSAAGAAVLPATTTGTGLKASSVLATGLPNTTGSVTTASAALSLKAPATTPAGAYSATLTLTLI